jgi:hypothetical protein
LVLVVLLLPALWYLTPRYGPIAAISVVVLVNVLERVILTGLIAKVLKLRWRDAVRLKGLLGIASIAFAAGAAGLMARLWFHELGHASALAICIAVFVAVYFGATLITVLASSEGSVAARPMAMLPEPLRDFFADLIARRARAAEAAGEKAA